MSKSAGHRHPKYHVLNFFYDKSGDSALTVLVNDIRFHIIVEKSKLKAESGPKGKLFCEYTNLLDQVKKAEDDFTKPCSRANLRTRKSDDCQDSGHGTGDEDDKSRDADSAVDTTENPSASLVQGGADPQEALYDWMIKPFGPIFAKKAPKSDQRKEQTVQEWYEGTTFFFSLRNKTGELIVVEEEMSEDLERRMTDILPRIYATKWMRELDIPWYQAKDLIVLDASEEPVAYHPSRVRVGKDTYFLKIVDNTNLPPTKRELKVAQNIRDKGLHKQMNVPLIKGLVGFDNSKTEMMGFLMTEIQDPTPLTYMLDSDVPQAKRDKWAKESERIKNLLHDNDVIWGDAKADNFMVDKNDKLWIIDFGGSYTDGWIDSELVETKEGDDMGVERVVNALQDPDANTWDPDQSTAKSSRGSDRKRKVGKLDKDVRSSGDAETNSAKATPRKRRKS